MSRDNLSSLLDSMLDESADRMEAEEVRADEARAAEQARRAAERAAGDGRAQPPGTIDAVEALTALPDGDLQKVLAKSAPDDLLVVLATAEDALQRAMLRNLSPDSVKWLRENLTHMDLVRDSERDDSRRKVLKAANALLAEGEIRLPEPESIGADEAPRADEKDLRDLLTDLVRIAEQSGPSALEEIAESAGEPLLQEGLDHVIAGRSGAALRGMLAPIQKDLERRYTQRLKWMTEALVAMGDGESAETFRARLFPKSVGDQGD